MSKNLFARDRDGMQTSRIHYQRIESLKPDPENERKPTKNRIRQLGRPALVEAATRPGLCEVIRIAEKLALNTTWDELLLASIFASSQRL